MGDLKMLLVAVFLIFMFATQDFGAHGLRGPPGPRGFRGFTGLRGFRGPQGFRGPRGFKGPRGYRGFTGIRGPRGFRGLRGVPGKPGPVQKLKCGFYKSSPNTKYSNFVRCPFLGHKIFSCSCWSPCKSCSTRHYLRGNTCRCACKEARATAVCCRVVTCRKKGKK